MKKFCIIILAAVLVAIPITARALSRPGSSGGEVRDIQAELSRRGYYTGNIDGIYGSATTAAVKAFQRDKGLTADGICGAKTLTALGLKGSQTAEDGDFLLLARIISAEARGESYMGQVAVGAVVLNRVEHPSFPDSIPAVVYQNGAFSCLYDGQFNEPISESAYSAAKDALSGIDPTGGAIYYYNPVTATSKWILSRPIICTIGAHVFCS